MYIDKDLMFSDAQVISASTDATGTNIIDLGVGRSIGTGEPMCVVFQIDVAADQAQGDEDYAFQVEYATSAAQTTYRVVSRVAFESGTPAAGFLDADLLVAGYVFALPVPPVSDSVDDRFLGVRYDVAGTTAGLTVTAWLAPQSMVDSAKTIYASGYSIT